MERLGVFCLEGDWETRLDDRTSVLPMLDMLERLGYIRFIRRDVATREEFVHYLDRWIDYDRYPLLYLGFHGYPDWLGIGRDGVDLAWIEQAIAGGGAGRMIHIGGCSTLAVAESRRDSFLRATGARGLSGYEKDIDWVDSAAFELALLQAISTRQKRPAYAYQYMEDQYSDRVTDLGFVHS